LDDSQIRKTRIDHGTVYSVRQQADESLFAFDSLLQLVWRERRGPIVQIDIARGIKTRERSGRDTTCQ